ncbi:MAG: hypothetical protein KA257_06430 [Opitutaceae bacterium]|nr:hypothetical protein [Opitutaceae bacterium]MBP9912244.1 hypothetical protein [Opitutaceae bacterium]
MKRRLLWLTLGIIIGMIAGYFFLRHRQATARAPVAGPTPAEVAIQDGKTIDFSSGAAQVKDTPEDRAALERAKKNMDEAAQEVTFAPAPAAPQAAKP